MADDHSSRKHRSKRSNSVSVTQLGHSPPSGSGRRGRLFSHDGGSTKKRRGSFLFRRSATSLETTAEAPPKEASLAWGVDSGTSTSEDGGPWRLTRTGSSTSVRSDVISESGFCFVYAHCSSQAVRKHTFVELNRDVKWSQQPVNAFGMFCPSGADGRTAQECCKTVVPAVLKSKGKSPAKAIFSGMSSANASITLQAAKENHRSTTSAAVLIVEENAEAVMVHVGHCGDILVGVIAVGAEVVTLPTRPHNLLSNPLEVDRVVQAGGSVVDGMIRHPVSGGVTALSRCIGDFQYMLKPYTKGASTGVIGDPEVTTFPLVCDAHRGVSDIVIVGNAAFWNRPMHLITTAVRNVFAAYHDDAEALRHSLCEIGEKILEEIVRMGASVPGSPRTPTVTDDRRLALSNLRLCGAQEADAMEIMLIERVSTF